MSDAIQVRCARIYIAEARHRRKSPYAHQRHFAHWLLSAAANCRREWLELIRDSKKPQAGEQGALF
jgi:hypothetical protein